MRCVYCGLCYEPDQNHPEHLCWRNLASANQACSTWKMEAESGRLKIAVLEEQLRQALAKLHRIANALLGEDDVRQGTFPVSREHDGRNPLNDSGLRL